MSSSPELRSAGLLNRGLKVCSFVAVTWGWDGGLLIDGTGVGVCLFTASCLRCCLCKESFSLWVRGSSGGRHTTSSIQERPLQRWVKKSEVSAGFLYNELSAVGGDWCSTAGLRTFLLGVIFKKLSIQFHIIYFDLFQLFLITLLKNIFFETLLI